MDPSRLEQQHVQQVYDDISEHFSATRYKPWPVVASFMLSLPAGSVGCDLGAGNGKNAVPFPHVYSLCIDCSRELGLLASRRGAMSLQANILSLPIRDGCCDFLLSIAVIHHLSTADRRTTAVQEMQRVLKPGGRALLFVWAFEADRNASVYRHRLSFLSEDKQDVLVPWKRPDGSVDLRYYHLFRAGELEALVGQLPACRVVESGYDRDNYFVVLEKVK